MLTLPASDDVSQMKNIQMLARTHIDQREIKNIAAKLLASLFYFETMEDVVEQADELSTVQGMSVVNYYFYASKLTVIRLP
jgi:hypothetical protein